DRQIASGSKTVRLRGSKCFPVCLQSGRIVHPRTLASLQRCCRVALGRSRSCDRSLAMQLGNALLSGPTLLNGALKLTQASSEVVTFALHFGKLGREGVALGGERSMLLLGKLPGVRRTGNQDPATVGVTLPHRASSSQEGQSRRRPWSRPR